MTQKENVEARIARLLNTSFQPEKLEIFNDSAKHAGHVGAGAETHFRVHIVAAAFKGHSRVERHRMVYAALSSAFADGLHALQVKALAPDENA